MSIQSEINRIKAAVAALAASITNKGVTVPDGTKLDGMAALVDSIQQGGGSEDWKITDGRYLFYQGARWDAMDEIFKHFYGVKNITSMMSYINDGSIIINCSDFDFSEAENATALFASSNSIKSIDGLHLPKCNNADSMFKGCKNITSVDLSGVFGDVAVNADEMFASCASLETAKIVGTFSNIQYLFHECRNLVSVDFTEANGRPSNLAYMFRSCSKLKSINLSTFDLSNVSGAGSAFQNCYELEEIIGFAASKVTNFNAVFPYGTSSTRRALKRLVFQNIEGGYAIKASFSVVYDSFDRDGMVEMFNSLPDVTGIGNTTISITGNPCVTDGTLTDEDRAIAIGKGWTLSE